MKAGRFDTRYPGCGGEDWDFVSRLDLLYLNRVVDWNITVQHTVPEDIKGILWHIYNRGRGTSYNDFIYNKKDPLRYLSKKGASLLVLLGVGLLIDWDIFIFYIVYYLCKLFIEANKMRKGYESPKYSIIAFYFLDKFIRSIGYDMNAFRHITGGIHYD